MSRYSYVSPGSNQPLVQVPSYTAQTMPVPALPAAALPAAATGAKAVLDGVISNLIAGIGIQGIEKLIFNPASGALGPTSAATASPLGNSKYFTESTEMLSGLQILGPEQLKRALLEKVGLGGLLPPLPTLEEVVGGYRDGQFQGLAALREAQARSLSERRISEIRAEKEYDYAARLAEAQASIQREKVKSLAEAQARVETQKVSSLGDVQRQRLQSQYGTAGDLLDAAIKNIAFRDKIESADTLTELARAV